MENKPFYTLAANQPAIRVSAVVRRKQPNGSFIEEDLGVISKGGEANSYSSIDARHRVGLNISESERHRD